MTPANNRSDDFGSESGMLTLTGTIDPMQSYTQLRLPDGKTVLLPTSMLLQTAAAPEGSAPSSVASPSEALDIPSPMSSQLSGQPIVIPIVEERLELSKRTVSTGVVRLQKTVEHYDQALDEPLAVRTYDIERVIFNRPVDSAPPTRQEGDTTVYSLVEEQLVLTKQLVLKEELRVTQRDAERRDTQVVTLRRERFEVERQK